MVERRSKVSIYMDILRTINSKGGKARPTHILYGANLSHGRLKKHLASLESEELIEKIEKKDGQTLYKISQKGLEFLSGYNKMKKFFDAFGVNL